MNKKIIMAVVALVVVGGAYKFVLAKPAEAEKKAGWELLFDGKTLNGWTNFKRADVRPGWQVKDGTLACVDPKNAGDIVSAGGRGGSEERAQREADHQHVRHSGFGFQSVDGACDTCDPGCDAIG